MTPRKGGPYPSETLAKDHPQGRAPSPRKNHSLGNELLDLWRSPQLASVPQKEGQWLSLLRRTLPQGSTLPKGMVFPPCSEGEGRRYLAEGTSPIGDGRCHHAPVGQVAIPTRRGSILGI